MKWLTHQPAGMFLRSAWRRLTGLRVESMPVVRSITWMRSAIALAVFVALLSIPQVNRVIWWLKVEAQKAFTSQKSKLQHDPLGTLRDSLVARSKGLGMSPKDVPLSLKQVTSYASSTRYFRAEFSFGDDSWPMDDLSGCALTIDGRLSSDDGGFEPQETKARIRCQDGSANGGRLSLDNYEIITTPGQEEPISAPMIYRLQVVGEVDEALDAWLVARAPNIFARRIHAAAIAKETSAQAGQASNKPVDQGVIGENQT